MKTDLQKFKQIFDRDRVKDFPGKLEYRVGNFEKSKAEASDIIQLHRFNLSIVSTGQLATYGAFEVQEL